MSSPDENKTGPAKGRGAVWRVALCLAVVTLAVFWRATQCDFVNYDDNDYVTENKQVQKGLTAESIGWAFTFSYGGIRIPLTWLSHMADWEVYGDDARGHHLTNILLHAANAVLLFLLLRSLTGSLWRSAFVAALFALHPLHVETAAWVSERKGALSTLFWLLALGAYARYARAKAAGAGNGRRRIHYALALVFFVCGLMTKPIVVMLPFTLLLVDYWPLERWKPAHTFQSWLTLAREKVPFFLLAAAGSALTFCESPVKVFTPGQCISNALMAFPRYLAKAVWPSGLAVPYPHPWNWPLWKTMLAAAFLTAATGLALQQARRRPYVTMGWLWFLVTLVPVLGLVQMGTYSIADRYTYVSLIGIFAMLAWAGGEMASRSERWKRAAIASAAVALGLCAWRSCDQLRFWQNSGTLFTHALEVTEDNSMAHNNLGFYFFKQGRPDEAMQHYVESARIAPDFNRVWENIFITMADERLDKEKAARYTQLLKSKRRTTGAFRSTPAVMGSVALGGVAGLLFLAVMRRAKTLLPPASPGGPQRK